MTTSSKLFKLVLRLSIGLLLFSTFSCENEKIEEVTVKIETNTAENEKQFTETMQKHLDAVSNKDIESLRSTMSPDGEMMLILPSSEILYTAEKFLDSQEKWFQDTAWTFETKILHTEIGERIGMAVTEIVYREPERNGKPYFNRMIVSYVLKKSDGNWYIIKDHASTVEKTK